jgi:transcriptional regulator with XRE-family HTH domain
MDILKLIGQRLKEARETCGFKQEEVAQKIGITSKYLSLLENGRRNPPLRMLKNSPNFTAAQSVTSTASTERKGRVSNSS